MISLYSPGGGILHRLAPGVKLAGLAVVSLLLSALPLDALGATIVLVVVGAAYVLAGIGMRRLMRALWQLRFLVLALAGFLVVFVSPQAAVTNTARMVAILLLATLVTTTTRTSDLLDVLHRMLLPLRRWGVNADAVALTLLMTMAMVPVIAGFTAQLRESERARGVHLGFRIVVPLFVMSLRHADDVGDALVARGLA